MSHYDAIVIGAGMSGLAAAIRLAMFDKRVLVVERHNIPGGLNSYYHKARRPFDVGLHAMTNYAPRGARGAPLTKLLRQLRIPWEALQLRPQHHSEVRFPGVTLRFTNDFEVLRHEVHRAFPACADRFDRFVELVLAYDDVSLDAPQVPARPVLEEQLGDPLLVEMMFCPLMLYGSAVENDMELGQFCTMFKSIFVQGMARPEGGVRTLIKLLRDKLTELGGELRFKRNVKRILTRDGRVEGVELEKVTGADAHVAPLPAGEDPVALAPVVLSSIGYLETLGITDGVEVPPPEVYPPGRLGYMESILVLDREPRDLGIDPTIVFFNETDRFDYRAPDDLVDLRSGVICLTNNFAHERPLPEGLLRITSLASWDRWRALARPEPYAGAKDLWRAKQVEVVRRHFPPFEDHVVFTDTFTPTTVWHFTRHLRGAIYGAPNKVKSGLTPVDGLFLCGTDQGFLGIVGAMLSGISIANARVLQGAPA